MRGRRVTAAIYAGLRRGELRAFRWTDIELDTQPALIHVRRTWDDVEGEVEVKTDAGFRVVPQSRASRMGLERDDEPRL